MKVKLWCFCPLLISARTGERGQREEISKIIAYFPILMGKKLEKKKRDNCAEVTYFSLKFFALYFTLGGGGKKYSHLH